MTSTPQDQAQPSDPPAPPEPSRRSKRGAKQVDAATPGGADHRITTTTETVRPAETPAERKARIERENSEHTFGIWKEKFLYFFGGTVVALVFFLSICVLIFSSDAFLRSWAATSITSIFTALLGFLIGKQSK
jgi:hypothetical protein